MSKDLSRKSDTNPYKHIRNKTSADWYMYWVCEDEDFLNDMEAINDFWLSFTVENPMAKEDNRLGLMMSAVKEKYGISDDEFEIVVACYHQLSNFDFPFRYVGTEDDEVIVAIPNTIKRDEYLAAWPEVKDMLQRETPPVPQDIATQRNRGADNPQLIYAIYKARKQSKTFSEIFSLYEKGELSMYSGKSKHQYNSEDTLERYYNKYKPDR